MPTAEYTLGIRRELAVGKLAFGGEVLHLLSGSGNLQATPLMPPAGACGGGGAELFRGEK